ncbi:hypothetical protein EsH8_X_000412 [Colletotrichum jinshuiense]
MFAPRHCSPSQLARSVSTSRLLALPKHASGRFAHPSRLAWTTMSRSVATTTPPPAAASEDQPKIKLYWLNDSRAQNTLWLLEELGLKYSVEVFRRGENRLAPPELTGAHPLGKAPVLEITPAGGAAPPLRLAESGYITQYLADHFGHRRPGLVPPRWREGHEGRVGGETEAYARYQYLLHYVEGSFFPLLVQFILINILKSDNVPFFIRPITAPVANKIFAVALHPTVQKHLAMLEGFLKTAPGATGNGAFLCGPQLTAADILISFGLVTADQEKAFDALGSYPGGSARAAHPAVFEYIERLKRQPGYLKALERAKEIEG